MAYKIEAECPKCGKKSKGVTDIESSFGWRLVRGKPIPQSYCKKCRKD